MLLVVRAVKATQRKRFIGSSYFENNAVFWNAEAPHIVPLPTKVEYLNGITVKMATLGSEHSLAISGMQ